ncbi:winged helix-turn-helix transcriptional regulator [Microbacterium gorillae]|uniref:winged helix-turn-helix transcriptional regulator n=1 Tax=Microbacterium gorillae TaxID=1231063 RepID=UPI00058DFB6A|nr:helix-turn-helix domain-containing protein [Microbacterium gorillae]
MAARTYGQYDGVSTAIELIGERWALLIVRDLLVGPRRYTDLKAGLPKIPTNILAARLKELQAGGVVRRAPIAKCGLVYQLTPYGAALEPIVLALGRWGFAALDERTDDEELTADGLTMALRSAFRPEEAAELPATDYEVRVGAVAVRVRVAEGRLRSWQLAPPAPPVGGALPAEAADLVISGGAGLRRLLSGDIRPAEAVADGALALESGDPALLERFATVFRIDPVR